MKSSVAINPSLDFTKNPMGWLSCEGYPCTKNNIQLLFDNQIPAIIVPNFLDSDICEILLIESEKSGFDFYENVSPPIGRIGITQFEHSKRDKEVYFSKVESANKRKDLIFQNASFDLLSDVMLFLDNFLELKTRIASEDVYGVYYAGLIRQIRSAFLHFDFAQYDAIGWSIESVQKQLSWNVYIEAGKEGGELVVYNRPWNPGLYENFKMINFVGSSYGFEKSLVENDQFFSIQPKKGDLCIFNTRNFHEVLFSPEKRVSISSFLGLTKNNNYILWS